MTDANGEGSGVKKGKGRKKAEVNVGIGNGILHVLDVIRWNGRDLASCEVGFRYALFSTRNTVFTDAPLYFRMWWRDTKLAELPPFPHSMSAAVHPTRLLPVPHYTDLRLDELVHRVIPAARSDRFASPEALLPHSEDQMDVMEPQVPSSPRPIKPDGLLLYMKEASYESGTSPLSVWVPLSLPADQVRQGLDLFETCVLYYLCARHIDQPVLFSRLLRERLSKEGVLRDVEMMDQ